MAGISNDVLVQSIREILIGADLSSLSAKKVRQKLEEKFGADLTDRKKEIDKILMKLISEEEDEASESEEDDRGSSSSEEEDDEDSGDHKRRSKKHTARNGLSDQSDEDEEDKGHSDQSQSDDSRPASPPPKKSKSHTSKSKKEKHGKSHHKKKNDSEMNDEQLAKKLQEEENNFRSRPRSVKRVPAPPKKERKPAKEGKAPRVSIYSKPCILSGELASVMGTDRMARKDVVKRMWEIVRERKLEDPKNKQFMLCDEQLQRVFGRKRVRTFGMMKHLKTHIKDAVD